MPGVAPRSTERPCDVLFLGSLTHRRAQILGRSAPILAQWTCDLRLFRGDRPVRDGTAHFVSGHAKHELLAGSRVLLNVHQGERDYFEWIRVIEAISNGCLVVTERSGGYAPLVPGRHFLQAPASGPGRPGRRDPARRSPARPNWRSMPMSSCARTWTGSTTWIDCSPWSSAACHAGAAPIDPAAPATRLPEAFRRPGRRAPVPPPSTPSATAGQESGQRALRSGGGARKAGAVDDKGHLAGRGQRLPTD